MKATTTVNEHEPLTDLADTGRSAGDDDNFAVDMMMKEERIVDLVTCFDESKCRP